jgi:hypothetical protein
MVYADDIIKKNKDSLVIASKYICFELDFDKTKYVPKYFYQNTINMQ